MATFYGGEQLLNITTLTTNVPLAAGILYTVPSGRYAEVFVLYAVGNSNAPVAINYAGISGDVNVNLINGGETKILTTGIDAVLHAGDTINSNGVGGDLVFKIMIKEYKLP